MRCFKIIILTLCICMILGSCTPPSAPSQSAEQVSSPTSETETALPINPTSEKDEEASGKLSVDNEIDARTALTHAYCPDAEELASYEPFWYLMQSGGSQNGFAVYGPQDRDSILRHNGNQWYTVTKIQLPDGKETYCFILYELTDYDLKYAERGLPDKPIGRLEAIDYWLTNEFFSWENVGKIEEGVTTLEEIKEMDPSTIEFSINMPEGTSRSYHRLIDGTCLEIYYQEENGEKTVSDAWLTRDPINFAGRLLPVDRELLTKTGKSYALEISPLWEEDVSTAPFNKEVVDLSQDDEKYEQYMGSDLFNQNFPAEIFQSQDFAIPYQKVKEDFNGQIVLRKNKDQYYSLAKVKLRSGELAYCLMEYTVMEGELYMTSARSVGRLIQPGDYSKLASEELTLQEMMEIDPGLCLKEHSSNHLTYDGMILSVGYDEEDKVVESCQLECDFKAYWSLLTDQDRELLGA